MSEKPVFTIGALGDSITTAFNALAAGDNAAHSWATGNDDASPVASHYRRIGALFPTLDVRAVNAAAAGAQASALREQVRRLTPARPDYVTILIGANDLARWLFGEYGAMLQQVAHDVGDAVRALIAANPRVLILLAGVPDQSRVLRLILGPASAQLGEPVRAAYRQRWERLNAALETVAEAYPANVRFAASVAYVPFAEEHLSPLDSYHPSVAGQKLLAAVTWDAGHFPGQG